MPKYEVQINRTLTDSVIILVEADNEDAAHSVALELASHGVDADDKALNWEFEDEDFEVEQVDELLEQEQAEGGD